MTPDTDTTQPAVPAPPAPFISAMRALALVGLIGLIVLGLAWELWLAPTGRGTLALKVLPLVVCVLGLWRHRMYTFRWLSLLVWLYFMEGVVRATTEVGLSRGLALLEVVFSVLLFVASALYIRWRLRHPLPSPVAGAVASSVQSKSEAAAASA